MPFQLKSSTEPTPSTESSSRSSMSSSVIALPDEVSGLTAPRAVRPDDSRLNQMLKKARKRCQATPIVRLTRDRDHPDERDQDLEHRHEVDRVPQGVVRHPGERLTEPEGQRVVERAGVLLEGVLQAAQRHDAQADTQDDRLDEVRLPHRRAEEAALRAAHPLGGPAHPVGDERADRGDHHEGHALGEPLPEEEVADQRQRELGVEELTERGDQGEEQQAEADEDEPVTGADPVPLQHPGVEQRLLEHRQAAPGRGCRYGGPAGRPSSPR